MTIDLRPDCFEIVDNCGGLTLEDAQNYAFHFGRRRDDEVHGPDEPISVYGIGLKRAVFKMGRSIDITSSTPEASFQVRVDVDRWVEDDLWQFEMDVGGPANGTGTTIRVEDLHRTVANEFDDPAFVNRLVRSIAWDYSFFLQKGLEVVVNGEPVVGQSFEILEGGDFEPARVIYDDQDIAVEIIAGMAAPPSSDDSAQADIKHYERYGWYVICNDRVVLAGDKSDRTVWGDDGFPMWHNQYNGFMGLAFFRSESPARLPWTTTKRDVDESDEVYRRAVVRMKELTRPFIRYTNERKGSEDEARQKESAAKPIAVGKLRRRDSMKVPKLVKLEVANILYQRPKDRVRNAAEALGNRRMSYKNVGIRTFEYFYEREVEAES